MVSGIEKLAEKMKLTSKEHSDDDRGGQSVEHQGEGGSQEHHGSRHEHHGGGSSHEQHYGEGGRREHRKGGSSHEGKNRVAACPVLIERSGATQTSRFDGKPFRVTIVASHWYEKVVHSLVDACSKELLDKGVTKDNLHVVEVAGAFELPFTAARLIASKNTGHRPDAVVCIGCFVEDTTRTCETMRQAMAHGIMELNVTSGVPVIFGVLCCDSASQAHSSAEKRSCYGIDDNEKCNFGVSWAQSALQMAHLNRCTSAKEMEHCSCFRSEGRSSGDNDEHKHKGQKHESEKKEKCTSCGMSEQKCSCTECVCKECCDHGGACTSCKSSADKCTCKDCKCRSCCIRRDACRRCGCPPGSCCCQGCDCAVCSGTKAGDEKTKTSGQSAEHATTKASASGHFKAERPSGDDVGVHVSSTKCDRCGNPSGACKCGLLH